MDKDRIQGAMKDIKGRVERQAGEWTGDDEATAKGTMDQAKGKVQNAFGKAKDAGRNAVEKIKDSTHGEKQDEKINREEDEVA